MNYENEEQTGSFEISKAEGDVLFKRGEYRKAIESFNTVCMHCGILKRHTRKLHVACKISNHPINAAKLLLVL